MCKGDKGAMEMILYEIFDKEGLLVKRTLDEWEAEEWELCGFRVERVYDGR